MNKHDLIIIQKQLDLISYAYQFIKQFPRSEKFALGNDIKQSLHQNLRLMLLGNKVWRPASRLEYLNQIDAELSLQKILVRLAHENKFLTSKKYFECEKQLIEIGKLLGGWMKATNKQMKDFTGA